jgi:hypothetical protein
VERAGPVGAVTAPLSAVDGHGEFRLSWAGSLHRQDGVVEHSRVEAGCLPAHQLHHAATRGVHTHDAGVVFHVHAFAEQLPSKRLCNNAAGGGHCQSIF